MKRISFLYFFSIISSAIQAQINTSITILKETSSEMIVEMTLGTIQQSIMPTEKGNAVQIVLSGCSYLNEKGAPALPVFSKSIIIPNQANASIQLLESDYEEYNNTLVAPSKGKYTRATDVSAIPFTFGQTYTRNEFYPSQQIALHDPFIFRDFRGQAIQFFPVQYNPVLGKLKVYRKIKVAIHFKEQALQNELHTSTNNGKVVDEFDAMYRNTFLNYAKKETRYSPISEIGSMLIVCPSIYLNSIAPFIKWKEMKGIQTFVVNTDTLSGGVTENTILNVASTYYQQKHIAYMLIVGDNTNIPARNENNNSSFLFGPSDMGYAYQAGNDHRPEFIVGRFSGENVVDIETQVQRTIAYEKNPNTIGNWMGTQIGIGSSICPSAGQATDDNQCDYEQIHDIVDSNKNQYNYVNNVELYDGVTSKGGTDLPGNPTTSMLLNAINDGASLINYSGHGATDGIITCQFATSNVPSISNANELPFFLVVGCRPGNFINTTSFSEALVRLGGSTPKGLISCFMSTVDQWIDAPMEVQDEFNAIMRGARLGNVKNRLGAMCVSGTMAMIDKYDIPSDPFGGSEMGDTWVFFGDPSVSLFK